MKGMKTGDGRRVRTALALFGMSLVLFVACQGTAGEPMIEPTEASSATGVASPAVTGTVSTVTATEVTPTSTVTVVAPEGLPFEQHADYREYESAELAGAGFVDTGAFLLISANRTPAAEVSYRAGFTAVRAYSDGYVSFAGSSMWSPGTSRASWSSSSAVGLKAEVEGQTLYLTFSAEWGLVGGAPMTRLIKAGLQGVAFYSVDPEDRRPELIVAVTDAEGLRYPAIIDTFGHLWVRPAPMLGGPVANDTGELLGVATAERLGPFPRGIGNWQHLTWCEGEACIVVLRSAGGLNAPSAGTASCTGGEDGIGIDFEAGGQRVHFQSAGIMGGPPPRDCDEGFPRDVVDGERLSKSTVWIVTAFDSSGAQIDVVADGEWLYIDIAPRAITECPPCFTGT